MLIFHQSLANFLIYSLYYIILFKPFTKCHHQILFNEYYYLLFQMFRIVLSLFKKNNYFIVTLIVCLSILRNAIYFFNYKLVCLCFFRLSRFLNFFFFFLSFFSTKQFINKKFLHKTRLKKNEMIAKNKCNESYKINDYL